MENRIDRLYEISAPVLSGVNLDGIHSTFIRNVSHELRTPLAVLMGYADLLNAGELGTLAPEQQEAMFIIVNRAQELRAMVSRIGTLLAVQAYEMIKHPLTLSALVAQMIEVQRAKAEASGITLTLHLASDLPPVIGDPQQLQQAIECLIENAIKFTPHDGQVDIAITKEPGWINLSVSDSGIGMDADEVERLSRPFQQLDNSSSRSFGGLGLGLTLVNAVVEAHSGALDIASIPGQGSRFTIKLPSLSVEEEPEQSTEMETGFQRILIVDDEEFVAFTLQEGLEKLPNCKAEIAMSGQRALELFEQQPFDLLITDYKMPDMNGVTLASKIRKHYPRTGIIMITAYSNDLIHEPFAAAAVQRVLNKPIRLSEIRSAATETLDEMRHPQLLSA